MCFVQHTRGQDPSSVGLPTRGYRDRVKDISSCIILHFGYLIAKFVGAATILSSPPVPHVKEEPALQLH